MTKFETKRKEIDILARMYEAVADAKNWDCKTYEYNEETERHEWKDSPDVDPDMVALYDAWLAKIEKMI